MTDTEALKKYQSALRYRKALLAEKPPAVYAGCSGWSRIEKHRQDAIRETVAVMRQAENAVDRLPEKEWRDAIRLHFIEDLDYYDIADEIFASVRTVHNIRKRAFDYLDK